jgi:hypothetical protein
MIDTRGQRRRRLRAMGAAAGDAAAAATGWVREMHLGIASRGFTSVGPVAAPVRVVHDTLAGTTYRVVGGALRVGARGAGVVAALTPLADDSGLSRAQAAMVEGIVCGMWGDHVARLHPELAIRMSLRSGGDEVALERAALQAAYATGGRRLAVFLHGLCETEMSWGRPAEDDDTPGTYGDRLRRELGMTPLFIRYNSGLPVAENGESLARLLTDLVEAWPEPVEEIALIGHSMGGLLVRVACDAAARDKLPWLKQVRHCVYLGTPHGGAPLERGVALLAGLLHRLPETTGIATALDGRSAGIKDLRSGYRSEIGGGGPRWIHHHVLSATLGPTRRHPLSLAVGDLLVTPASAAAHGIDDADSRELFGLSHFDLLDHPAVAEALREWLSAPPAVTVR